MLRHPRRIIENFQKDENIVFFRQWLKHPLRMGAIAPSSKGLAALICQSVQQYPQEFVIELGAGTGRFTEYLLEGGINPDYLIVIEMDPKLCQFLHKKFPHIQVICGDAASLSSLLPANAQGHISTIISGLPLISIGQQKVQHIIDACFHVLSPQGQLLQFTYGLFSPLSASAFGLRAERIGRVLLNLPPASVWRYSKALA